MVGSEQRVVDKGVDLDDSVVVEPGPGITAVARLCESVVMTTGSTARPSALSHEFGGQLDEGALAAGDVTARRVT